MSQGSGEFPVNFLDIDTCENILQGLRREDETLPSFDSDSDTPPPVLEAAVACYRGTQTPSGPSQDQGVQALPPQLRPESSTQTLPPWTRDNVTQMPHGITRDNKTQMPQVITRDNVTQMPQVISRDNETSMPSVTYSTTTTQTKVYFDTAEIPPGAPCPTLPWGYSYHQFDLLQAYPEVHPEDFVTFGILQEQPRRGTHREWGEVAGVLLNMIGGRR